MPQSHKKVKFVKFRAPEDLHKALRFVLIRADQNLEEFCCAALSAHIDKTNASMDRKEKKGAA